MKKLTQLLINWQITANQKLLKGVVLLLLSMLCFLGVTAQSKDGLRYDIEMWTEVGLKKEFFNKWDLQISYAHRFQDTFSTVKNRFFDAGTEFDLTNDIEIGISYRLFLKDEDGFAARRWMPYINFEPQFGNFRIRWRSRLDVESKADSPWRKTWRNQFRLKFKPDRFFITPSVSYELFHYVGNAKTGSYKNRLTGGLDFKLTKQQELKITIGAQQEWRVRKPQFDKIIAISYQIDF